MYKLTFLLAVLLCLGEAQAQWSINTSKRTVRQQLRSHCRQYNIPYSSIREQPYSMELQVRDTAFYETSFFYDFDKKGRCYRERKVTTCDSCYRKYRNDLLAKEKYEWTPLNDTVYVSRYAKNRRLELHPASHTVEFFKVRWTKNEYAQLVAKTAAR